MVVDRREPPCGEAADANADGVLNLTDAVFLFDFLFRGGSAPPQPGAPPAPCGVDPDPLGGPASLGCEVYNRC